MGLSWQTITVQQFQDIYRLSLSKDMQEMDKLEKIIAVLYNLSERQVEDMQMAEFKDRAKECSFVMSGKIPGKPVRKLTVGKKRFAIQYDPTKLRHRQYVELLHFGDRPIENMHLIMASIVQPVRFGLKRKNKAEAHESTSFEMLNARVIDVYHSCVFFCNLYVNLIQNIKASLVVQMMSKGMTKDRALKLVNSSRDIMAGFIPPGRLRILNV